MIIADRILDLVKNSRKLSKPNRYFREIIEYDYKDFVKNIKDENFVFNSISNIVNGDVYILRSAASKEFCKKIIRTLDNYSKNNETMTHKILDGVKNGYFVSKNLSDSGYKTNDRSFYFFSWNKDETMLYEDIINLYKPLKILNGLKDDEITTNIPSDGVVERVHVIHYPNGGGQISKHVDPTKLSNANFGLYCTQYGKDYHKGGFFVENKKNQKVELDKKIKLGDLVIFFPGLIHGVDPVYVEGDESNSSSGRWFCNINLQYSHHVKNREYAIAMD